MQTNTINLISDTVTKPSAAMLEAMFGASVGDDVFGEDQTVNELQSFAAEMFGMEAALFCPSGTMTNQIALAVHCKRLEEVICDWHSHIFQYETGGYASNSGIAIKLLHGEHGKLTAPMIEEAINPVYDWLPKSSLVVLENTVNKAGGSYYQLSEILPIQQLCKERGLKLHLDGARLFNALVESKDTTTEYGKVFDSISICLSKGLGAPVGSLLLGKKDFILQAKRQRKAMGGGMRQAGYLAAAGLFALQHNVERLAKDHENARILATTLGGLSFVKNIRPVSTNILIFDVEKPRTAASFLEELLSKGIKASAFGPQTVRFVTHLDFTDEMLERTIKILSQMR